ncbi:MAG TPA: PilZ domain-containing protein [Ruminiclostridium sp.]
MQKENLVLRHYNKLKPINCTVISGDTNKIFTVKLDDIESNGAEIIKGDPVLIGILNNDDTLLINGGSVLGATPQQDKYIICSNDAVNMAKESDKRQFERYPTSLLGDIKLKNTNKREPACIKDFSSAGMCIYSTENFSVNDIVEVRIYLSIIWGIVLPVIKMEKIVNKTISSAVDIK